MVFTSIVMISIAVPYMGMTAFVGLLAPMIVKKFIKGIKHVNLILLSFLVGGILVLISDFIGRAIINRPFSMPSGLLISIVGGCIFIFLAKKDRYID